MVTWDLVGKALVKECPQDFVTYLAPGATYVGMRETNLQTRLDSPFGTREIRGDVVPEAKYNGQKLLTGVELQSTKEEGIGGRLLFYSEEYCRLTGLPTRMGVFYTSHVSDPPASPLVRVIPCDPLPEGNEITYFHYKSLAIADTQAAELWALDLDAFCVFSILCRDGGTHANFERVLERLLPRQHERKAALAAAFFYASKVMISEEDSEFLERKRAKMEETLEDNWLYQKIYGEQTAKAEKRGQAEGEEMGVKKGITALVQTRFPEILSLVKDRIASLSDLNKLQKILILVGTARTAEEVQQFLLAF